MNNLPKRMLPQNRSKNDLKSFYERPVFEEALVNHPEEISNYLKKEESYLRNFVKMGSYVAEIGSGDGRIIRALEGVTDNIIGMDFAGYQVRQAKSRLLDAEIIRGDARKMPVKNGSVDYALFMWNTFGNLVDGKLIALNEAKRILKPKGTIILSVYSESALDTQLKTYESLGLHVEHIDADLVHTREGLKSERFSTEKLRKLIENAGLYGEIIELTPVAYIAELRKPEDMST